MNYILLARQIKVKADALLALAKSANRAFTPEEKTQYAAYEKEIDDLMAMSNAEKKAKETDGIINDPTVAVPGTSVVVNDTTKEWKDGQFGEFLQAVIFNPADNRLKRSGVKNTQTMGTGSAGGYTVPEVFLPGLRLVDPQAAIIRSRAEKVGSGDSPDAEVKLVALDQTGSKGVFGGVTVAWGAEGFTRSSTDSALKEITLQTNEVGAYTTLSNKLLRNSSVSGPLAERLLRAAITNAEEYAFLRGDGVGKPLGIVGHPATINISRNTASDVKLADIVGMTSRMLGGGAYIWLASQSIKTKLKVMVDAGNNLVWQANVREGEPQLLDGIPIFYNTNSPVLGNEGDLVLADFSKYIIKDGQEMSVFVNPFLNSRTGYTDIQINYSVDGKPWLTSPIMLEDAVTTVSPFIVLE